MSEKSTIERLKARYETRYGKLCFRGTMIPVRRVFAIQALGAITESEAVAFEKKVKPEMINMAFEDHNDLKACQWNP